MCSKQKAARQRRRAEQTKENIKTISIYLSSDQLLEEKNSAVKFQQVCKSSVFFFSTRSDRVFGVTKEKAPKYIDQIEHDPAVVCCG